MGEKKGTRKKARAQKVTLHQAAVVVAPRQYMPIQNGAANSTGKTHVSCNCSKTSIFDSEMATAPNTTRRPVMRPMVTYSPLGRVWIDIRSIDVADHQCGPHDHVGVGGTHQCRQQASEHEAGESGPQQFARSEAPGLLRVADQSGSSANSVSTIRAVRAQPIVQKRFRKLPATRPHAGIEFGLS